MDIFKKITDSVCNPYAIFVIFLYTILIKFDK